MSYTALYRKYRPDTFSDVKGQDVIVRTLKNQIRSGRIGHAYLFCGTRGTGKTTAAKIFAKAVNCEDPRDGEPCGECAVCRGIARGSLLNVIEIDAASNNGVDNIRRIREEVTYAPTEGKYRVYIIDEVHMLSKGAFNALLKTLEEPPSYVIFILATTEAHTIPVTILSRCQRYDFHRITTETICARLYELMEAEGVSGETEAVEHIAKAADGSMRDALSLLDQCISFYPEQELTYENVLQVLGAADTGVFSRLLRAVIAQDAPAALQVIDETASLGRDLSQFAEDFIWYLRCLLLLRASEQTAAALDLSQDSLARLREEAAMLEEPVIMRYIRVFSDLTGEMRYSGQKRVLLEVAVIRLLRPASEQSTEAMADRIAQLERRIENGVAAAPAGSAQTAEYAAQPVTETPKQHTAQEQQRKKEAQARAAAKALPEEVKDAVANWDRLLKNFQHPTRDYLMSATPTAGAGNKLMLVFADNIAYTYVAKPEVMQEIRETFTEKTGREFDFSIREAASELAMQQDYFDLRKILGVEVEVDDRPAGDYWDEV